MSEVSTISGLSAVVQHHRKTIPVLYEAMPPDNIGLCFLVKANKDVAPSEVRRFEVVSQTAKEGTTWSDYDTGIL